MRCPNSQADNPDKNQFCSNFRTILSQISPLYSAENPHDKKYHRNCGQILTEQVPLPRLLGRALRHKDILKVKQSHT